VDAGGQRKASDWEAEALPSSRAHDHTRPGSDGPPKRKRINWNLITDLDVSTKEDAIEKLAWYAMRWKIEVLHKILMILPRLSGHP
jgi:hypothetical protein